MHGADQCLVSCDWHTLCWSCLLSCVTLILVVERSEVSDLRPNNRPFGKLCGWEADNLVLN